MNTPNRITVDTKPDIIQPLNNGSYYYNYNIIFEDDETYSYCTNGGRKLENKTEIVIANYIETMMKERRQRIFASDEYIQQDNGDLVYLEERYNSLNIPHTIRRVIDDYIACLESRDERYADMSYVAGMGDAIKMLMNMGVLNNQGQCLAHAE